VTAASVDYWSCPDCGRKFARTGQKHVCDTTTVEDHLEGQPPELLALFDRFVKLVRACGRFEYNPTKRQIGFQAQRIFAGVKLTNKGLEGYLDIARRIESDRFRDVAP
jgi:hypothetical protein